jgi:glycosyltransferase involved in cell wall biosynthesis
MSLRKVLVVASHRPGRAPNQRFRIEQYLDHLRDHGFECTLSYFINEKDDAVLYTKGHYWKKFLIHQKSLAHRKRDLKNIASYDLVFIVREALLTGNTFFEEALGDLDVPVIYDFDDALWRLDVSDANKLIGWLKNPAKTSNLIGLADAVVAGNQYLADYASTFNDDVTIIPSTVDTAWYKPLPQNTKSKFVIGWSGSITTIKHFEVVVPALKRIKAQYGNRVEFRVVGDGNYRNTDLDITGVAWTPQVELEQLSQFDVGLMPLPDDEWTKGKCGLKGLLYMSMEVPPLMSPVGVNTEIVTAGVNGFLPDTEDEWVKAIQFLIEHPEKAKEMGKQASKTVLERYSVGVWKNKYLELFQRMTQGSKE